MNELHRPPLGIRLTLLLLVAVVVMGAASGTFARMSLHRPEPSDPPVAFTPTGLFACRLGAAATARGEATNRGCAGLAVPPPGTQAATWTLDSAWRFYRDATELHVLVQFRGSCPAYAYWTDVIAQHVEYGHGYVAVSLVVGGAYAFIDPVNDMGDTVCPDGLPVFGNNVEWVLKLAEPVGDRVLIDAGTDPSTVVRVP